MCSRLYGPCASRINDLVYLFVFFIFFFYRLTLKRGDTGADGGGERSLAVVGEVPERDKIVRET